MTSRPRSASRDAGDSVPTPFGVSEQAAVFREDSIEPTESIFGDLSALFDREGLVSIDGLAERFGLSKSELAETIGVNRDTVFRPERFAAPKTQARTAELLEILHRITAWAGGGRQAIAWYRAEPLPAFGGRTAEALVKEGKAAAVRDFLDHVATGGFA